MARLIIGRRSSRARTGSQEGGLRRPRVGLCGSGAGVVWFFGGVIGVVFGGSDGEVQEVAVGSVGVRGGEIGFVFADGGGVLGGRVGVWFGVVEFLPGFAGFG